MALEEKAWGDVMREREREIPRTERDRPNDPS
jgi:hypothetical protein